MARTARARRTRVRRGAAPVLPEELVLWDIIIRLRPKDVLRCRAVCRLWRHLTSGAEFLLAHHRRQPSLPLVTFHGQTNGSDPEFADAAVDALDLWGAPAGTERQPVLGFDDYNDRRKFTVHASCDGLLVLSLSNNRFYICNPATRQWAALPNQLICSNISALYQHSSSGEYRILYCKSRPTEYYVLTVGSSLEPRYIGQCKASVRSVLLHNCLHWVINLFQERKYELLVFDITLESFRYMTAPATDNLLDAEVLEMDGTLSISCLRKSQTTLDIWVLQDYEMEVWSLKYHIELPVTQLSMAKRCCLVVSKDGDILIYSFLDNHPLFYCDNKRKVLRKFEWDRMHSEPNGHWFKESLVHHAFFHKQARARARQPRFFRGHIGRLCSISASLFHSVFLCVANPA